jgi:hypothetical protein
MGLRETLRRLRREASEDAVLIRQRDGSVRTFDRMHVLGEMFLARLAAGLCEPARPSDVLEALEGATLDSRRAVEEMSACGFTGDLEPSTGPPPEDLSEP